MRSADDLFHRIEKLIYDAVWAFHKQHGGDFEELKSEAFEHFIDAYLDFNSRRGTKLRTWIRYKIHKQLLETYRKQFRRNQRLKQIDHPLETVPSPEPSHFLTNLLNSLSSDARTIVELVVVDTPPDITICLLDGATPRRFRSSIREYLSDLGWSINRIRQSFAEIRSALES